MNILIANTQEFNPQIGGVEKVSSILAEEFVQRGHNVFFLACVQSPYSKEYTPVVSQILLPDSQNYDSVENVTVFVEVLRKYQIDIVMNQAGNIYEFSNLCFVSAELYEKVKVISVVHIDPVYSLKAISDFSSSILPKGSIFRTIARRVLYPYRYVSAFFKEKKLYSFVYSKSLKVVLLSSYFKKNFQHLVPHADATKLTAILNPSAGNLCHCSMKKENALLYIGRLDFAHKRVDRLLEIWARMYKDFPDWRLDIVGDGPIRAELEMYVRKNNIDNVHFAGITAPFDYYSKAQILCMTSTYEGFPMVLLEGMRYGCIPISYDSFESIHEIIINGKNGYIIPSFNKRSYEVHLRKLMETSVLRDSMNNNLQRGIEKFDLHHIADEWITLFTTCTVKLNGEV